MEEAQNYSPSVDRGPDIPGETDRPSPRDQVLANQRARLLGAMAEVVAEKGLRGTTATQVAKSAGVSRTAFSQQFDDIDDCFLALLDWMLDRGVAAVAEAFRREQIWDHAVLAGLEALLVFLDAQPTRARACLLESMTGLPAGFESRSKKLGELACLFDTAARQQLALERQPPPTIAEATVASVLGILRRRLLAGAAPPFVGLLGQLTEIVVAPYLGPSATEQAANRAGDRARVLLQKRNAKPEQDGVEVPSMLRHGSSHRLRSCLEFLASNPNVSNQDVSASLGIAHSGQVSMLLGRLHDGGLLVKECGGPGRPNAWRLSPNGADVVRVLSRH